MYGIRLDADVIAMAVDDSETEIFALADDPHPRILRFKIPKLRDTPQATFTYHRERSVHDQCCDHWLCLVHFKKKTKGSCR